MKLENLHRKTSSTGDLPNRAEDPEDRIGHVSIKKIVKALTQSFVLGKTIQFRSGATTGPCYY